MPDHAVYRQRQGGDGSEKSWSPLSKLTQEEASEILGGVMSGVELDGYPGGPSLLRKRILSGTGWETEGPRVWLD